MAKRKTIQQPSAKALPQNQGAQNVVEFPALSAKEGLECTTLLEDQILIIDDLLSAEECKFFVKCIGSLPLELTPPKKRGEAERVNHRLSVTSPDLAQRLAGVLFPHLPSFPHPASMRRGNDQPRKPHSLNTNIRVYKYTPSQHFGPHYDDSVRDALTGVKSEWTLLIYLTGQEDGIKGGETIFYRETRGKPKESIIPPLRRGMALLHRHGKDCLLHEGSMVEQGVKYVLRSDLMFM
ncbi:hypothetical protein BDN72DRAFT_816333 [Pluteus cervinus]|uniref:Uncharacterized protein n=1 Tax=Pluteus cervinus TaxID=181527 RepID=A0ACD3B286_9AGAR|nr:hypothetical protein BDN72DRAFT_816333 [Pluteus cervinus]